MMRRRPVTDRMRPGMVVLVGGHAGSGKSVLRSALHSHPQLTLLDDLGVFRGADATRIDYVRKLRLHWRYSRHRHPLTLRFSVVFLARLAWRTGFRRRVMFDDVTAVLHRIFPEAVVVGDVHSSYLHIAAGQAGRSHVKAIMVYRDCRDVAATINRRIRGSWARKLHRHKSMLGTTRAETASKVAQQWLSFVEEAERLPEDVVILRYEDLVREPRAVLESLGEWLGVAPDLFNFGLVHTHEVGIYGQLLSQEEIAAVVEVAGPKMTQLGYL